MSKTIITIGGTNQFNTENLAFKKIDEVLKKHKITKKELQTTGLIYGYQDGKDKEGNSIGAFTVAENWAKKNNITFKDGSPKNNTHFTLALAERNNTLASHSKLLINLRVGDYKNGGKGILEAFELKGVPIEVVDVLENKKKTNGSKKETSGTPLTPKQKRKGETPTKEAVEKSVAIYSKVAQKLLEHRCLMLDTETTGLGMNDEVVEIAIGDCASGVIIFDSLIKSSIPISAPASEANGITNDMLINAPTIDKVWDVVEALVGNRVVLASHSTSETEWFDERLLNQSLYRYGITCSFIWKDLQPLYRLYSCQLKAGDYPLKTEGMCLQLGLEPGTHRAKNDVLAQIRILQAMANGVIPDFEV